MPVGSRPNGVRNSGVSGAMPILAAETELYPDGLLDQSPDVDRPWRVAHTRPRQEKALARELYSAGLPFYLPCDRRRLRVRGRATGTFGIPSPTAATTGTGLTGRRAAGILWLTVVREEATMPTTNEADATPALPYDPVTGRWRHAKPPGAAEELARAQGKLHTATLEHLESLNIQLFESDEEFERFQEWLRESRRR